MPPAVKGLNHTFEEQQRGVWCAYHQTWHNGLAGELLCGALRQLPAQPPAPQDAPGATNAREAMRATAPEPAPPPMPPETPAVAPVAQRVSKCSLCTHDDHEAINAALRAGTPLAQLARHYGKLSSTWSRHRMHCLGLPPTHPRAGQALLARRKPRGTRICAYSQCDQDMTQRPLRALTCSAQHGALYRAEQARAAGKPTVARPPDVPRPQRQRPAQTAPLGAFDTYVAQQIATLQAEAAALEREAARKREQISGLLQYQVSSTGGEAHDSTTH